MPTKREKLSNDQTAELQKKIIENLVSLQKVNSDLSVKFDKLATQIANLLNLFESAARTFAEQAPATTTEKDKEFLEKIDKLLEQNKTIARGLTLMEEKIRERVYGQPMRRPSPEEVKRAMGTRQLPRI